MMGIATVAGVVTTSIHMAIDTPIASPAFLLSFGGAFYIMVLLWTVWRAVAGFGDGHDLLPESGVASKARPAPFVKH